MVWVAGHVDYDGGIEVIGVAATQEVGQRIAGEYHDEVRDHKVTGPLHWDENGVSWSVARGVRYDGSYVVEEFPIVE